MTKKILEMKFMGFSHLDIVYFMWEGGREGAAGTLPK